MHLDNKLSLDQANLGREHRARSQSNQEQTAATSPGTPTERTVAGGPTPVSRPEQQPLPRDERDAPHTKERRKDAQRVLARMLRLPANTTVALQFDVENEVVRFQVRDRDTGELIREIPPDESASLLDELKDLSGALVDRSL